MVLKAIFDKLIDIMDDTADKFRVSFHSGSDPSDQYFYSSSVLIGKNVFGFFDVFG